MAQASVYPWATTLMEDEKVWVQRQPFIEERGYNAHQRYHPDWISEAQTTGKSPFYCEDSIQINLSRPLPSLTRRGSPTARRWFVRTLSWDTAISAFLTNEPGAENQVLELIPMSEDPKRAFMVMTRMRMADDLPFSRTVGGITEFVQQVLETRVRLSAGPMKYYYIDFNLSVRFATRGLVTGECGHLRKRILKISGKIPYDLFKVDVRLFGETSS
ncbi:hypothetical protein DFH09DRAFT_1310546 [Mycena vulgaris]|nr:hypothetical protein DFH09DRAFT_1310546 [Mycena vulgaris]